jgi:hypothetical protein
MIRFPSLVLIGVAVTLVAIGGWYWRKQSRRLLPSATYALREVDSANARPVTERELAGNTLRRAAGLVEVKPGWFIAPTKHFICDGPSFQVVLGEQRQPVLVIEQHLGRRLPGEPVWTEYEGATAR